MRDSAYVALNRVRWQMLRTAVAYIGSHSGNTRNQMAAIAFVISMPAAKRRTLTCSAGLPDDGGPHKRSNLGAANGGIINREA